MVTKEMKCNLSKGRDYYVDKYNHYNNLFLEAKKAGNKKEAKKWRDYAFQYQAKINYFDNQLLILMEKYYNKDGE